MLARGGQPLTMPDLLAALRSNPRSSVYRNVGVLELAGVVRRVRGEDERTRFELAEDLTGAHHHHLLCSSCGRIADYAPPSRLERAVQTVMAEIRSQTGFVPRSHRVDLVGLCPACA